MKRFLLTLVITTMFFASPAFALFINGGFETGDFTGWTIEQKNVSSSTLYGVTPWSPGSNGLSAVIDASTAMQPGQTSDVDPYNGTYMARINDISGNYHATQISQSDTLVAADLTETLYVNWGAMLVDPSGHNDYDQPTFGINVYVNGSSVYDFTANGEMASTDPSWAVAGSQYSDNLYYRTDTWSQALTALAIGDLVSVKMWVTDCGQSAHGGFAFLDGIGTVYQPPGDDNPVPEPATILLFGFGLLGLAGISRKRK